MSIGIGQALREAREDAGIRLADAAAETRIRQPHLVALEEENFAPIGGDVYVKGFIRSYARHLGVDPDPLVRAYHDHYEHPDDDAWASATKPVESPPPPRRPITTIVVVLAVLTLGGLALLGFLIPEEPDDRRDADAPDPVGAQEPPDAEGSEDVDDGDVSSSPDEGANDDDAGDEGEEPDEGADDDGGQDPDADDGEADEGPDITEEVVLTLSVVDGRSWARITVNGEQVDEATYDSGYSETYTGEEILVRVGDAANVSLEVNGEDLGPIGDSGDVVNVTCSSDAGECEIG